MLLTATERGGETQICPQICPQGFGPPCLAESEVREGVKRREVTSQGGGIEEVGGCGGDHCQDGTS